LAQVRASAAGARVRFDHEYCGPPPETVITDPQRARDALAGLIIGAAHAGRADIYCLMTRVVRQRESEALIRFDVIDPTTRLSEDQIGQLLHPLCDAQERKVEEVGRPGLGIPTSKRLAQLLGGDVTILPLSNGTRYRLTLAAGPHDDPSLQPMADAACDRLPSKREDPCHVPDAPLDCRILLVEDDQDHQPLLSMILRRAGSQVTIAENGQVAMERVRAASEEGRPFDIILMDVQMPVLDGLAATRMLRSSGVTSPIIAVTARAMNADRQKCLDAGCDDFVPKPIDRGEFVRLLSSHVGQTVTPN